MENMNLILQFFILLPLLGFVVSLIIPKEKESLISWNAFVTVFIHLIASLVFTVIWLIKGCQDINLKEITIIQTAHYEFFIDFYFDNVTAVYSIVGTLLTLLVTVYSRYYLHKESGYKRFFNTILFFFIGYNTVVFSGNFETLFIGWEVLGLSSFLLIAFYRDRYLPSKNALKVFSVYRIGDVGFILAMWASHHLWHENITFAKLNNYEWVHEHLSVHEAVGVFISLMILIVAATKSAQLPFSSWLPRAMEGPTPSSAIFYGSLSVHLGVFLLLRTFPFWEHQISMRILIGLLGLITSIITSLTARVQSNVKSQIAYASIAQIGIIFIEVALGLEELALIHFAGNAFLRTYQLLVSPSVVSYLIKEQFYNFIPRIHTFEDSWAKKIEYGLYILCLKEWNLDSLINTIIWSPFKSFGKKLNFLTLSKLVLLFVPSYLLGLLLLYLHYDSKYLHEYLPGLFSIIGLLFVFKSFSERKNPKLAWVLIILYHFWSALAISFNEKFNWNEVYFYLSGVVLAGIVGWMSLNYILSKEKIDLNEFYGAVHKHPKVAFIFLMSCLGLMAFPITPTFVGVDLIFSHIQADQFVLAIATSTSFVLTGIALIRMYARIFLGPAPDIQESTPFKSS